MPKPEGAPVQSKEHMIMNKEVQILDMQDLRHLMGRPFSEVRDYVHHRFPEFRFPTKEEFEYMNSHLDKIPRGLEPLEQAEHKGEINIVAFDTTEGEEGQAGEPVVKRLKLRPHGAGGYEHRTREAGEKSEHEARLNYDDVIILFKER